MFGFSTEILYETENVVLLKINDVKNMLPEKGLDIITPLIEKLYFENGWSFILFRKLKGEIK